MKIVKNIKEVGKLTSNKQSQYFEMSHIFAEI